MADAARATLGLDINACVVTSRPVGVTVAMSQSGASWGSLAAGGEDTLIEAARKLKEMGSTAIAGLMQYLFSIVKLLTFINYPVEVVCRFPEDGDAKEQGLDTASLFKQYQQGEGVDAIAGAEALISHVISKELGIPCAHAPAFDTW